jgi:hypothetical protein
VAINYTNIYHRNTLKHLPQIGIFATVAATDSSNRFQKQVLFSDRVVLHSPPLRSGGLENGGSKRDDGDDDEAGLRKLKRAKLSSEAAVKSEVDSEQSGDN